MMWFLAIDGGGTVTRAGLYQEDKRLLGENEGPPCNPLAYGLEQSLEILVGLSEQLVPARGPHSIALAAGVSGAAKPELRDALGGSLFKRLGAERVIVTDDVRPILFGNLGTAPGVVVVAGTGSGVAAQTQDGRYLLVGGRGRVFGDDGGAYQLVVAALRAAARAADGLGPDTILVEKLAGAAGQSSFADMAAWSERATKREIAALAAVVADTAEQGDEPARECICEQAGQLAEQAWAAYRCVVGSAAGQPSCPGPVLLHGGLFRHCRRFRVAFEEVFRRYAPFAPIRQPEVEGHRAVVEMAFAAALPEGFPASVRTRGFQPSKRSCR